MSATDERVRPSAVTATKQFYVTKPTRTTIFLRTFVPWQLVRFGVINVRMLGIIRRSHRSHPSSRSEPGSA